MTVLRKASFRQDILSEVTMARAAVCAGRLPRPTEEAVTGSDARKGIVGPIASVSA